MDAPAAMLWELALIEDILEIEIWNLSTMLKLATLSRASDKRTSSSHSATVKEGVPEIALAATSTMTIAASARGREDCVDLATEATAAVAVPPVALAASRVAVSDPVAVQAHAPTAEPAPMTRILRVAEIKKWATLAVPQTLVADAAAVEMAREKSAVVCLAR